MMSAAAAPAVNRTKSATLDMIGSSRVNQVSVTRMSLAKCGECLWQDVGNVSGKVWGNVSGRVWGNVSGRV